MRFCMLSVPYERMVRPTNILQVDLPATIAVEFCTCLCLTRLAGAGLLYCCVTVQPASLDSFCRGG